MHADSPKDLVEGRSRASVVVPLKWRSNPAGVNRRPPLPEAEPPSPAFTGCNNKAGGPRSPAPDVASHPYRGEQEWLACIRRGQGQRSQRHLT